MTSLDTRDDSAETGATIRPAGVLVAVLAGCGIVVSLMQTLVIPIVPELPTMLHTSAANASWVITATLLAGAIVTPISGRLGDMFGKRRILLASLTALVAGSLVCALFSSLIPMIVGRTLQGLAVGAIPLGISILRDELPAERVGSAIAMMSATLGVGGAIGLPFAAVIAQNADWHALFWISGALGAICAVVVFTLVPESPVRNPGRFDFAGAVGLSIALISLLLAITKGSDWGWSSATVLGLVATAVVALVIWGAWELRAKAPLVDLAVSARPRILLTNLASIAVGFAMYGMSLVMPQLLQAPAATGYGLGQSMVAAGLALAPGGLMMMLLSPVSAKLTAARGPKVTLIVGCAVIALGYVTAFLLMNNLWEIMIASMIIAGGIGIAYAAMPALIMGGVPVSETAAANGLNALMRSIGTSTSAAVMSVVLAHMTMSLGGHELPSEAAFHTAFGISITAAIVAIGLTAAIPMRSKV